MSNEQQAKVAIPPPVTDEEVWIVQHRVDTIRVEYRQTGDDTAETYLHLTDRYARKTAVWRESTFRKIAELYIDTATIVRPRMGVVERVSARLAYEKNNAAELATYKRLHAKYGATK